MIPGECYWKGRPLTELSREELLQVCCHMYEEHARNRDELQRRLNALDVKKYLMNGGSSARV